MADRDAQIDIRKLIPALETDIVSEYSTSLVAPLHPRVFQYRIEYELREMSTFLRAI